jgi:uncharacterized protein
MTKFVIKNDTNGLLYYILQAQNGQRLLLSEGYTTKAHCTNGIEAVKMNARIESRYQKKITKNGKYNFILTAGNQMVIGISELHETAALRDKAILLVQEIAPGAIVEDAFDEFDSSIALIQFVKEKRKQLGLSQQELAEKAGVGLRFLREMEQGKNTLRVDKVNQVLRLFGYEMAPVLMNRNNLLYEEG